MQVDAKIFNGLPVTIYYHLEPAQPDIGIMRGRAEIDEVYTSRIRKRDGRQILSPIPPSWWQRLIKSGELNQLEETLSEEVF